MKIAIDIMGGDYAPDATLEGSILAREELSRDDSIVLVGKEDIIREKLRSLGVDDQSFEIAHASEIVEMGENPTKAFSKKPDSSIAKGFGLLKSNLVDAFCSVGNTGAMMVGSMFTVRAIPGIIPGRSGCLLGIGYFRGYAAQP